MKMTTSLASQCEPRQSHRGWSWHCGIQQFESLGEYRIGMVANGSEVEVFVNGVSGGTFPLKSQRAFTLSWVLTPKAAMTMPRGI